MFVLLSVVHLKFSCNESLMNHCVQITASSALLLRALDMAAIGTDFEISRGFNVPWRSHQWQGNFLNHDDSQLLVNTSICNIIKMNKLCELLWCLFFDLYAGVT